MLFRLESVCRSYRALGRHLLRPQDVSPVARFIFALSSFVSHSLPEALHLSPFLAPFSSLAPSLWWLLSLVLFPLTLGSALLSHLLSSLISPGSPSLVPNSLRALAFFNDTGPVPQLLAMQSRINTAKLSKPPDIAPLPFHGTRQPPLIETVPDAYDQNNSSAAFTQRAQRPQARRGGTEVPVPPCYQAEKCR
ncbi:hypothetical protein BC826DRAFT_1111030 [Russula brevipes]|nr:hypothetical protein BC826DRAFT_1111030 [Russula brevipes]